MRRIYGEGREVEWDEKVQSGREAKQSAWVERQEEEGEEKGGEKTERDEGRVELGETEAKRRTRIEGETELEGEVKRPAAFTHISSQSHSHPVWRRTECDRH